jgi:hypothetical protein
MASLRDLQTEEDSAEFIIGAGLGKLEDTVNLL